MSYSAFFERATGNLPFDFQLKLGEARILPSVVEVPTGTGKTHAMVVSWLYQRRLGCSVPRRLVYALPMRTLVEQTVDVVEEVRRRLGLDAEELPVHVLMGGAEPSDWRGHPEADQIIIGTIDMLLSRALNRGYVESRFGWPISFGLLNNDSRWVFDEVQLMGPARATSAQLDGLREKLGTLVPCESVWVSATVDVDGLRTVDRPELGKSLGLSEADWKGPLATRLSAVKRLERIDAEGVDDRQLVILLAKAAAERHVAGTRTLVVANTVGRAQDIAGFLREKLTGEETPDVVLVHSRFRPPDRARHLQQATRSVDADGSGTIVVATQVIEAGVDMSSRTLITETAPFSSVVQRLGRCNRAGEYGSGEGSDGASVVWVDAGLPDQERQGERRAAPYLPADVRAAREALLELEGESLSPARLAGIGVPEAEVEGAILRRRDLLDLFDTSPDLSGLDVDVAPFIREDDERSVSVFYRRLEPQPADRRPAPHPEEPRPERDELVQVPIGEVGQRTSWAHDYVDGGWRRVDRHERHPGQVLLLDAAEGGYTEEMGWVPRSKVAVEPYGPRRAGEPPESDSDEDHGSSAQTLEDHLAHVHRAASEIAESVGLRDRAPNDRGCLADALQVAAGLHDIGKAHAVFQRTLRGALADGKEAKPDGRLWAKSGGRTGHHERPHFRHELASALAIRGQHGHIRDPDGLVSYLVAAHHGRVRLSIQPAPGEEPPHEDAEVPFARGVVHGEWLPAVDTPLGQFPPVELNLTCMELGDEESWAARTLALRNSPDLGPFRLGMLEALLRIADWRGSA